MATGMRVLNVEQTFKELANKHQAFVKEKDTKRVKAMVAELREATPVDTGKARSSWSVTPFSHSFAVVNDTTYIEYLNQGTSKQAPAYFIESIALKYGKPLGSIVTVIDNYVRRDDNK